MRKTARLEDKCHQRLTQPQTPQLKHATCSKNHLSVLLIGSSDRVADFCADRGDVSWAKRVANFSADRVANFSADRVANFSADRGDVSWAKRVAN